jgi:hypothetical protein
VSLRDLSFAAIAIFVAASTGYVVTEILREFGLGRFYAGSTGGIVFGITALWLERLHRRN